jgi:Fic family protein
MTFFYALQRKKKRSIGFAPLPPELETNIWDWYRVELIYTSNAIEGNTLTREETALVIEKDLTVQGKGVVEHLEAKNHGEAVLMVRELARQRPRRQDITENDLLQIHARILAGIDGAHAGRYRSVPVRVAGSQTVFPNHLKVPEMMAEFFAGFDQDRQNHPVYVAMDAHYQLVSIHPFVGGNGRAARLFMNLLLLQAGYPPVIIRPENRLAYIQALEKAQTKGELKDYYEFMYRAALSSLEEYLRAIQG